MPSFARNFFCAQINDWFGKIMIFQYIWKSLLRLTRLHLFDQKYSKNSNVEESCANSYFCGKCDTLFDE